jgi:putative hemolysin
VEALAESRLTRLWDLVPLAARPGPVIEFADLRMRPDAALAEVLRAAWGAVATASDRAGAATIVGTCAFPGLDPAPHAQALALLRADHVAPQEWLPPPRAPGAVPLVSLGRRPDRIAAVRGIPPLLRSWLGLGAWVADQVVPDPATGTLDVCAILDPARIPSSRVRALRAHPPFA